LVFNRDGDIKAIFQLKKIKLKKLYFTNGEWSEGYAFAICQLYFHWKKYICAEAT
jgi:hypothetical protein